MAKVVQKSPAPLYFAAAVWLAWGLCLPLYRAGDFLLAVGASAAAALAGGKLFPDKVLEVPDPVEPETTGDPELDALLAERDQALGELRRLRAAMEDKTLSGQLGRLEEDTRKIVALVVEKPEKLPQIRKFMSYYLPTTLKLLNAYDRMDDTGISGANIDSTKAGVARMMGNIVRAFDRQLDALFADEALDISTDITVMEQFLAQEGLSENGPFSAPR